MISVGSLACLWGCLIVSVPFLASLVVKCLMNRVDVFGCCHAALCEDTLLHDHSSQVTMMMIPFWKPQLEDSLDLPCLFWPSVTCNCSSAVQNVRARVICLPLHPTQPSALSLFWALAHFAFSVNTLRDCCEAQITLLKNSLRPVLTVWSTVVVGETHLYLAILKQNPNQIQMSIHKPNSSGLQIGPGINIFKILCRILKTSF